MRASQWVLLGISAVLLAVIVVGIGIFFAAQQTAQDDVVAQQLPTLFVPPTATHTLTPTSTPTMRPVTPTPSVTPSITIEPSQTPTPTATLTVTRTPSPTITNTAAFTDTPPATNTPTRTPGPTQTPIPTFLFGLLEPVRYETNFANTLGCAWQGIGGQVFDLQGDEWTETALQVRISTQDNSFARTVTIGTNSNYGARSGYEIQVDEQINDTLYFVTLLSPRGTALSDIVQVRFPAACDQNVAIINWAQQREAN